ncbi:TPA: hypothetical protein SLZ51_003659 [Vibrio cholerae]|nr:hypothetical protein [Vibrio cholerae]
MQFKVTETIRRIPNVYKFLIIFLGAMSVAVISNNRPVSDPFGELIKINKNDVCKYYLGRLFNISPMLFSLTGIEGDLYTVLSVSRDGNSRKYACGFTDDFKRVTWSELDDAKSGIWKDNDSASVEYGYHTNTLQIKNNNFNVVMNVVPLNVSTSINSVKKEVINDETVLTDKMASYATIIGRAAACGVDTENELRMVGKWIDSWFDDLNVSTKMRTMYLSIFMQGTEYHMNQQLSGNSPDSCQSAIKAFNTVNWP